MSRSAVLSYQFLFFLLVVTDHIFLIDIAHKTSKQGYLKSFFCCSSFPLDKTNKHLEWEWRDSQLCPWNLPLECVLLGTKEGPICPAGKGWDITCNVCFLPGAREIILQNFLTMS